MKNIRYVCCQPAIPYYTWQVEVVINNFKRMGINPNLIDIVCSIHNNEIPEIWKKMQNHYNTISFLYNNDRIYEREHKLTSRGWRNFGSSNYIMIKI